MSQGRDEFDVDTGRIAIPNSAVLVTSPCAVSAPSSRTHADQLERIVRTCGSSGPPGDPAQSGTRPHPGRWHRDSFGIGSPSADVVGVGGLRELACEVRREAVEVSDVSRGEILAIKELQSGPSHQKA